MYARMHVLMHVYVALLPSCEHLDDDDDVGPKNPSLRTGASVLRMLITASSPGSVATSYIHTRPSSPPDANTVGLEG